MSGGGGSNTTATQYTSNVPEYASGAFMDLVGRAQALSNAPYQPYTGERVAQFTPLQKSSFDAAAGLGSRTFTDPSTAQQYMSPYIQNVLQGQLTEAQRQADIAGTNRAAQFTKAGGFGGSRQAIMDAEAARNLAQQKDSIMATGLQKAFEAGQGQFNTEFGQQLNATGMQNQFGTQQQQQVQGVLDRDYADFQAQRDAPYQQIGFLSDVLRGSGGSTRSVYSTPQASGLQAVAGLGTLAAGLSKKKGGVIDVKDKRKRAGGLAVGALSRM